MTDDQAWLKICGPFRNNKKLSVTRNAMLLKQTLLYYIVSSFIESKIAEEFTAHINKHYTNYKVLIMQTGPFQNII